MCVCVCVCRVGESQDDSLEGRLQADMVAVPQNAGHVTFQNNGYVPDVEKPEVSLEKGECTTSSKHKVECKGLVNWGHSHNMSMSRIVKIKLLDP